MRTFSNCERCRNAGRRASIGFLAGRPLSAMPLIALSDPLRLLPTARWRTLFSLLGFSGSCFARWVGENLEGRTHPYRSESMCRKRMRAK